MWDPENLAKIVTTVVVPILTLIGFGSRRRRLRNEIKDNLELVREIEKHQILQEHTLASGWLQGRIALDVARLSGVKLGTPKAPIPKGSVVFAGVLALGFAIWTYWLDRNGFVWYSIFPGLVSILMLISIVGNLTNRQLPPNEVEHLPPGAVLAPTDTAGERIATTVAMAASGSLDDRAAPGGQVDTVFKFVRMLQSGHYQLAISLAEENWILCRVHAWLWNNRSHFGNDVEVLEKLAQVMLGERHNNSIWNDFVATESAQFVTAWKDIKIDDYGFAGRRRRIARDIDLVILVPMGNSGAYFVMSATALPNAMSFLVRRTDDGWKIVNHIGYAPPTPGWPPIWWYTNDPVIEALPDE
ncbi:hypothetical protein FNH05_35050 [Amycolatopsis rhizosphaerae]|uniref:Uncharacterized protein n=1 Tax=Amycolatopsis rhizosphaerae TaxID=2053003 RepID=A0A558A525_9PSEU|nr:hypothetical protein [Amycolatopsis rhizosphaerae]TVT19318.1 hypothetical protein FNH05_35050 [Amycolatopsis rhizosphaerae]